MLFRYLEGNSFPSLSYGGIRSGHVNSAVNKLRQLIAAAVPVPVPPRRPTAFSPSSKILGRGAGAFFF